MMFGKFKPNFPADKRQKLISKVKIEVVFAFLPHHLRTFTKIDLQTPQKSRVLQRLLD